MAFMGTKQRRDLVANANILQEPVWPELVDSTDDDDFQTNVGSRPVRPSIPGAWPLNW